MGELDQVWMELLNEASLKAFDDGRHDLADYLRLKLANDTIRRAGVEWLFNILIERASEASKTRPQLKIDRVSPHSFRIEASNMVGSLIQVQQGIRCISLEAGWVRTPSDGIMRNGALAHARIRHFGMATENAEYRLIRGDPLPIWIARDGSEVRTDDIHHHFQIFLGH